MKMQRKKKMQTPKTTTKKIKTQIANSGSANTKHLTFAQMQKAKKAMLSAFRAALPCSRDQCYDISQRKIMELKKQM